MYTTSRNSAIGQNRWNRKFSAMAFGTSTIRLSKSRKLYAINHEELRKKCGNFRYDPHVGWKIDLNTVDEESAHLFYLCRQWAAEGHLNFGARPLRFPFDVWVGGIGEAAGGGTVNHDSSSDGHLQEILRFGEEDHGIHWKPHSAATQHAQ